MIPVRGAPGSDPGCSWRSATPGGSSPSSSSSPSRWSSSSVTIAPLAALAAVAAVSLVAYAVLPNSAPGSGLVGGLNFGLNVRYALPAIAAVAALTASLPFMATVVGRAVSVGAFAVAVAVGVSDRTFERLWEWQVSSSQRWIGWGVVVLAAAVTVGFVAVVAMRHDGRLAVVMCLGVVIVVVAGGWWLQRTYLRDRYAHPRAGEASSPAWAWAQDLPPTRIGIVGDLLQYPYTGRRARQ